MPCEDRGSDQVTELQPRTTKGGPKLPAGGKTGIDSPSEPLGGIKSANPLIAGLQPPQKKREYIFVVLSCLVGSNL